MNKSAYRLCLFITIEEDGGAFERQFRHFLAGDACWQTICKRKDEEGDWVYKWEVDLPDREMALEVAELGYFAYLESGGDPLWFHFQIDGERLEISEWAGMEDTQHSWTAYRELGGRMTLDDFVDACRFSGLARVYFEEGLVWDDCPRELPESDGEYSS